MSTLDAAPVGRRASLFARVFHRSPAGDPARDDQVPAAALTGGAFRDEPAGEAATDLPRLYLEGRRQIKRRAWGHAQRALEAATGSEPDSPAELDLRSVRAVRRALRRAARWPSDVEAHLELGRAYFDLDLGPEALAEFVLAQRLGPRRFEGYALAALEYLYRGEYAGALGVWTRACQLNPELPSLDEVLGSLPLK